MLAPINRLRDPKDFDEVKRNGKRIATKDLVFSCLSKGNDNPVRIGLVITKKVDKRATARNRTARLIREAIRLNLEKIKPGHDIVIVARSVLNNFTDCENQVREAIVKLNLNK